MPKYFLNIKQSGSTKKDNEWTFDFDLKTPLLFPSALGGEKEFKHLEIKTSQQESDFFRNAHGKGGVGNTLEYYWNLHVPDDNQGFSLFADNDKLTLGDVEGKIYLELYNFPHSTLTIKPQEITWNKENLIRVKIDPVKIREGLEIRQIELKGKEFGKRNKDYQDLILNAISKKEELKINFRSDNNAYFRKSTSLQGETLVILPDSLQENLLTQNNSSPTSKKPLYFFLAGVLILAFLFLVFWLIKRRKLHKK